MSNEIITKFEILDETTVEPESAELNEIKSIARGLMLILHLVNPERLVRGGTVQEAKDLRKAVDYVRCLSLVNNISQFSKIQI